MNGFDSPSDHSFAHRHPIHMEGWPSLERISDDVNIDSAVATSAPWYTTLLP